MLKGNIISRKSTKKKDADSVQPRAVGEQGHNLELNVKLDSNLNAELREQSELLHLAHDSIIVRDVNSVILFWNRGAEETYGWSAAEACGNVSHQFLKTEFPEPFDQVNEKLFNGGS